MQNKAYTLGLAGLFTLFLSLGSLPAFSATTWVGPVGGDWFTAANWNNGLPAAGNDALIGGGNSVVIGSALAVNFGVQNFGSLSVSAPLTISSNSFENSGTMTVSSGGSVTNLATFKNFGTTIFNGTATFLNETAAVFQNFGPFTVPTTFTNKGSVTNNGTIDATGGTVQSQGSFDNNQTFSTKSLTVAAGSSYTNNFGSTLNISGTGASFDASGSVTNNGTINNAGVFSIKNNLTNNVSINNNAGGSMTVFAGVVLNNGGTVLNKAAFVNNGTVQNGNQFQNEGTADNYGAFNNNNVLDNRVGATFTNRTGATLDGNFGTNLINAGSFINQATIGTFGQINNSNSFTNSGAMSINTGATLNNNASFTNNGSLNSSNAINNNSGATWTNNGTLNINSGCIFSNTGNWTNTPTGQISNFFEIQNKPLGVFTNNGRLVSFVRIFIQGSATNNGYVQNQGDFYVQSSSTFTNAGVFEQQAGNFSNSASFVNSSIFTNDDCSTVNNKSGAIINNTGGALNNRGIVFQRGTVSGNAISNQGGYIHTAATSAAPAVCKNVTVSATDLGEVKVYATSVIAIANIDSCQNILYTANGIPRPLFSCSDIGSIKNLNVKMVTRLGDSLTCVSQVTPVDLLAPKFSNVPQDITVYTSSNSAVVTWTAPTAVDNCSTVTLSSNFAPGAVFNVGITGVIYTAKDIYNNTQTVQFKVSVVKIAAGGSCSGDVTGPVFSGCPANQNITTDFSSAAVSWTAPTIADGCQPLTLTTNFNPGSSFPEGTTLVKYTAKDGNGNTSTCQFAVTVTKNNLCATDNIKPVIVNCPANIYLPTNPNLNGAVATWTTPSAGDNCALASFSSNFSSGSIFPIGTTTVTYSAADASGNTAACSFNVTVGADPCPGDVTGPVFSNCPTNISLTTNGSSAVATWTAPTATDACGPVTMNASHISGSTFTLGNTQVVYQASDKKGNKTICSFNISVTNNCLSDATPPVISNCPANLTVPATSASGGPATWTAPTVTDNCGISALVSSYQPGAIFPVGTTAVNYTATDLKGNTAVCAFTVNVVAAPSCVSNAAPINNATAIATPTVLTWNSAQNAASYDIYLSTANPPTTLIGNAMTTTFTTAALAGNTKYFWYVVPKNIAGSATGCSSNVTNFTTQVVAPSCASGLVPANNSTGLASPTVALSWGAVADATSYDVYVGTTNSLTTVTANVTTNSYSAINLLGNMTYFWKVVPKNAAGAATGCTVNQFTTANTACPGNVVVNGGFEGTSNSQFWNSNASLQTSTANSGSKSWGTCQASTASGAGFNIPVVVGQSYTMSVYSKISGSPAWAGVGFDFYNSSGALIGSYVSLPVTSTTWQLYTITRTAPAGAVTASISFWKTNGGCQYADDFCFTQQNAATCKGTAGKVLREYWNGIAGSNISDLKANANYPNSPSGSEEITQFEKGSVGDNYGTRVRGFLTPSVSGQYVFFVSGDDNTEFYLSTDNNPANKVLVSSIASWTNQYEWYKFASQKSVAISLTAGQDYYMELLHKEGGGGDHFAVYWCPPGVTTPQAIPSARLSSFLQNCTPACNKSALFVVGNATLNNGDQAVFNRLQALGLTVTVKTDVACATADATGKALIVVSSTSLSTNIGNKFTTVAVPIICYESRLYDDLKMTSNVDGVDYATYGLDYGTPVVSQINMIAPQHPIAGNLSGWRTVYSSANYMQWGKPSAGATIIGEIPNQPNKEVIFAYETGATMVGMTAPARRVGFFLYDATPPCLTADGWKLFDNAVKWATNCASLNNLPAISSTAELVFDAYPKVNKVELKWISRTGERNDFFVVERSTDAQNWQSISDKIDGAGEAQSPLYFRIYDENPLDGLNFYRLRLIFNDGSERFSDVQPIDFQRLASFEVFPNPTQDELFVNLKELAGKSALLRLFDQNGKAAAEWQVDEITAEPLRLSLDGLLDGHYVLWISGENHRPEARNVVILRP